MFPMMQMMQYINNLRQNPNGMADFLLRQGRINKQQYDEIQSLGIGGNPPAIGQYLMNHGMMNQSQVQDAYQNQALPIQQSMRQN